MSMYFTPLPSTDDSRYFEGLWARLFGQFIQSAREKAGLAVESAAWLADMCPQEWTSIEAGDLLPTSREQLELIAVALDIKWATMASIVAMCRQAWGIQ